MIFEDDMNTGAPVVEPTDAPEEKEETTEGGETPAADTSAM